MAEVVGILPGGNQWLPGAAPSIRNGGLGKLAALDDLTVMNILEYCDAKVISQLASCSRTLLGFCSSEPLWMQLTFANFSGDFRFVSNWRTTYIARHAESEGRKPPVASALPPVSIKGLYSDLLFQPRRVTSLEIGSRSRWLQKETIPRVSANELSLEDFATYEREGKPVIITGVITDWPALTQWTRQRFLNDFPDVELSSGPVDMKLKDFFLYAERNNDEAPMFIFDARFADPDKAAAMDCEYTPPVYFQDDLFTLLPNRPDYRWILLGHKRSGSKWHVDPNCTHAWNAVVSGAKRWFFLPPGVTPPGVFPTTDGSEVMQPLSIAEWILNFYNATQQPGCPATGGVPMLEGTLRRGEVMFVPSQWWHAVVNLEDDTFAVTQNLVSPNIAQRVRRFLRYKSDQVSGIAAERIPQFWREFDEVLSQRRPELVREEPQPFCFLEPEDSSPNMHACARRSKHSVTEVNSSDGSPPPAFSFWSHLKSSKQTLVIG